MTSLLIDGPEDAFATLVLAHGAGAGMEHDWMEQMTAALTERGMRVIRFEFAYMHARREGRRPGPDRMPKLLDRYREVLASQEAPVFLGGKSMGGRVATMLADEVACAGVVAFGYPFHPPGKPDKLRTAHLQVLQTPLLIVQGERDTFGTREEVASYGLAETVQLAWMEDGDHSLKPRKKSGLTLEGHLAAAASHAAAFCQTLTP